MEVVPRDNWIDTRPTMPPCPEYAWSWRYAAPRRGGASRLSSVARGGIAVNMQRYPIMSRRLQSAVEITAYGYAGRTRQCWIEEWPDGWVVQEGTDSSFAIVTDKLPSRVHAIDAVFDFIAQEGGNAVIEDEVRP